MYILSFLCPFIIIISSTIFSSMTFAADPVFNSVNRHYYQLVEIYPGLNWSEAKAAAEALEYNRRPGYLATITTEQEQDFVVSNFPKLRPNHVWLGASDEANEGWFSWITGESDGYGIGRGGMYANWDSGEP